MVGTLKKKGKKMRILINRLIEWMMMKDFSMDDIVECLQYVTKK